MNRTGLTEMVRCALGGTATTMAASLSIEAVLRAMRDGLWEDGSVKLAGFGSFTLKQSPARRVLNPRTAAECIVPARRVLRFKASPQHRYTD